MFLFNSKGMKVLERAEFNKLVSIPALKIDAKHCSRLRKGLSRILLKQPRIKDVIPAADSKTTRLVLLCLHMTDLNGLKNEEKTIIEETEAVLLEHKFPLTYEHYTADQVLSAIMPAGAEVTTAFETIGHIAHMNLKEHQLQYKHLIGECLSAVAKWCQNSTESSTFMLSAVLALFDLHKTKFIGPCLLEFEWDQNCPGRFKLRLGVAGIVWPLSLTILNICRSLQSMII